MDLDVVFLGTSASMPTAHRGPAALLVRRGGERLLFDCGEGTQRQLQRSTRRPPDLRGDLPHALSTPTISSACRGCSRRSRCAGATRRRSRSTARAAWRALQPSAAVRRPASVPAEPRRARAGGEVERGDYVIEPFAVEHGMRRGRVRARRGRTARGASTSGSPTRSASRPARARPAPGGRGGDAPRRPHGRRPPRSSASPGRAGKSCSQAIRRRPRSSSRRRRAPTCSSTRRVSSRGGRARKGDDALDCGRGRRGRAPRAGAAARAHARLAALLRARARARSPRRLPRHGRAARLRRDRGAVPRARRAPARQEGCAARRTESGPAGRRSRHV